jgi:Zinc finger, C3HC4 type (RING finger)
MQEKLSLECPICFYEFKDPRVLVCGHSFCKRCIANVLQNDCPSCPMCRKIILVTSVKSVSKNYSFSILLNEYKKVIQEKELSTKNYEQFKTENEYLKEEIKNLKGYLEISANKIKIAQNTLKTMESSKKENEKLKTELNNIKNSKNSSKMHENIIINLEMKIEEYKIRIKNIFELVYKHIEKLGIPDIPGIEEFKEESYVNIYHSKYPENRNRIDTPLKAKLLNQSIEYPKVPRLPRIVSKSIEKPIPNLSRSSSTHPDIKQNLPIE